MTPQTPTNPEIDEAPRLEEHLPTPHPRYGFMTGSALSWSQFMALCARENPMPPAAPAGETIPLTPEEAAAKRQEVYDAAQARYLGVLAAREAEEAEPRKLRAKLDAFRKKLGGEREAVWRLRDELTEAVEGSGNLEELTSKLTAAEARASVTEGLVRSLEAKEQALPPRSMHRVQELGQAAEAYRRQIILAELAGLPESALPVLRRAFAVYGGGSVDLERWKDFLAEHLPLLRQRVDTRLGLDMREVRTEVLTAHGLRV